MKKIISIFLMISTLAFFSVFAFATEKADISFDSYESDDGEKVYVDVIVSESGDPSMMQFCVSYDSSALKFVSASAGEAFSGNNSPIINHVDGKIYFIWDSLTPLSPGGIMLHIEFVPISPKNTSVGIDESETFIVADSNFNEIGNVVGSAEIELEEEEKENGGGITMEPVVKPEEPEKGQEEEPSEEITPEEITESLESEAEITEEEKTVIESSDEDVAVIEDGNIVPVSPGTTTITVKTEDGEKEASMEVTVTEDGKIETVEVIKNEVPKKKTAAWIFVPIAAVIAGAAVVVFRKSKKT